VPTTDVDHSSSSSNDHDGVEWSSTTIVIVIVVAGVGGIIILASAVAAWALYQTSHKVDVLFSAHQNGDHKLSSVVPAGGDSGNTGNHTSSEMMVINKQEVRMGPPDGMVVEEVEDVEERLLGV
jgi:hypothetical protein